MIKEPYIAIEIEKFKEVKSQSDFDELDALTAGFHDSLIKEVHIVNSAYVDEKLSMYCSPSYNIRLLIQTQWRNSPALEVILGDVRESHFYDMTCISFGQGTISFEWPNKTPLINFHLDSNKFVCRRFLYRMAPELWGKESRFGDEIILDKIDSVEWIDNEWVMCKNCCEAWMPGARKILKCPKCGY